MDRLIFEKVGDVNSTYPYLCVYMEGDKEPFMEIAVTEEKSIKFTFYSRKENLALDTLQLQEIMDRAMIFLPKVIADGNYYL